MSDITTVQNRIIRGTPEQVAQKVADIVTKNWGVPFRAVFVKKDKTLRTMNCLTGHNDGTIKGVGRKFNPDIRALQSVYDTDKKEYRFVNLMTIREFQMGNLHLTFEVIEKKEKHSRPRPTADSDSRSEKVPA